MDEFEVDHALEYPCYPPCGTIETQLITDRKLLFSGVAAEEGVVMKREYPVASVKKLLGGAIAPDQLKMFEDHLWPDLIRSGLSYKECKIQ
ncbi:MAG: hypothetical protein O7C75_16745 [Verrucomicrobia bacterium]|nr:hypothetical protein [Verrucomicrobiota bacterium]